MAPVKLVPPTSSTEDNWRIGVTCHPELKIQTFTHTPLFLMTLIAELHNTYMHVEDGVCFIVYQTKSFTKKTRSTTRFMKYPQ